ncbi:MAG: SusE domain-containing protein [Rhizobacter sp.]|nr:SusE domain-containing protein [Ferruginibacter sp.]
MKKIVKLLALLAVGTTLLYSCKKDENQVVFEGGTPPSLTASANGPLVFNIAQKNDPTVNFRWTNPDYKFNTGLSSQDVTYTLEIDTAGSNFSNAFRVQKAIANDQSYFPTVGELNTLLLSAGWLEDVPHNFEIRLKSSLANSAVPLYSNVVKITITPYLDVVYPVPADLYITGNATPASWQCGCNEADAPGQKFTKVSSSKFELSIELSANNSYLFLPDYGSWSAKYGFTGDGNLNNVNGADFKPNGNDIKAPATTKVYKITVDFKTGKFSVE